MAGPSTAAGGTVDTTDATPSAEAAASQIEADNASLRALVGENAADKTAAATAKKAAATKKSTQETAQQKALRAQIEAVQNSPWTQLSNALVQQYQQTETPVAQAISGSQIPAAQGAAANQALASLGLSPNSSAGSWLASQTAAAQATAAPVEQAMAQEGAQYAAEAQPIEKALAAGGQANALAVQTAPEASWLSALASHVQSNLNFYGGVAPAQVPELEQEPSLVSAFQQAGGGTSGSNLTPVTSLKVANGKVTAPKANASAALTGTPVGSIPSTNPGNAPG